MARHGLLVGGLVAAAHLTADARADAAVPARPLAETIAMDPTECLSPSALTDKTTGFLQRDQVDARLSMAVTMRGPDAFFQLSRTGIVIGERLVPRRNLTCEEFLSVVALALAVAIDSALLAATSAEEVEAAEDESVPVEPLPAVVPASPTSEPVTKGPPPSPPKLAERHSLALTFEPAVLSVLHEPTIGGALGLVVARHGVGRLGLTSLVTVPATTDLGGDRARVGLIAGRLDACLAPPVRMVPIAPCAGAIFGVHRAEGVVLSTQASSVTDSALWGALALGPELTLAFGRWSVAARVEPWWIVRPSRLVTVRAGTELSVTATSFGAAAFLGVRRTIF